MKRLILSIIALAVSASPLAASVRYVQLTPNNKSVNLDPTDIVEVVSTIESGDVLTVFFQDGYELGADVRDLVPFVFKDAVRCSVTSRGFTTLKITTPNKDSLFEYVQLTPISFRIDFDNTELVEVVGVAPKPTNTTLSYADGTERSVSLRYQRGFSFAQLNFIESRFDPLLLKVTKQGYPATIGDFVSNHEKMIQGSVEAIGKNSADIAKNVTAIAENGSGIATNVTAIAANATAIGANATTLGIHERRIAESLLGSEQSRSNEERLETAELRITESLITNDQSKSNEERLETAELRIAESLLGSEQSRSNEERLEVIAADIATNSTTIQDNATGIAANGTAIAGNGTSIQDIATGVAAIGTSVQDNATGITANGTAIANNGTSIQDIATSVTTIGTSVQDNATSIAANGTAIAGNGTSIQDIATGVAAIGTSVQDNATGITANGTGITSNASSIATNATTIAGNATSAETNSGAITQINLTLQANQNERGRNALEIGQNQLRFQALENQIGSLGSDAAFIQKLGDEFATKDDLTTVISEGKTQGINAVTSDPNNWNIFTADQIQEMAVGDLVLTREENGDFVLNYEIQQSDNAKDWTTYSAQAETITGLPVNKAFVRIRTR